MEYLRGRHALVYCNYVDRNYSENVDDVCADGSDNEANYLLYHRHR